MSVSPKQFKLTLIDPQEGLCQEWKKSFASYPEVEIRHGYFEQVKSYDCMVSPANSFGLMDGGVDLAIRNYFGLKIQYFVQRIIQRDYYGEQPVGTSFIVFTEHEEHPFLAHTPTMRVPMSIAGTDNVYNAFFAMLRAVANHNKQDDIARINKVLCPGFGTYTGNVAFAEAARQMALAYKHFHKPTTNMTWPNLIERNNRILSKSQQEG